MKTDIETQSGKVSLSVNEIGQALGVVNLKMGDVDADLSVKEIEEIGTTMRVFHMMARATYARYKRKYKAKGSK